MINFGWCQFGKHFYYTPSSPVMEIWTFGFFDYRRFLPTETTMKLIKARKEVEAFQNDPARHAFTCANGCGEGHIGMSVVIKPKEKLWLVCRKCGYEQLVDWEAMW